MEVRLLNNQKFLLKIAVTNLKKNKESYFIYFIACCITVFMYAMFQILVNNSGMKGIPRDDTLILLLTMATWVVGIFSVLFLVYANSFLMKRRKKEFGLYGVLGLEKRHVIMINFYESAMLGIGSILIGLIATATLGKMAFLLLIRFIGYGAGSTYNISSKAVIWTIILFGILYFILFVINSISIKKLNLIALLKEGEKGEKEPKEKIIMTIIGLLALGYGYYLSITTKDIKMSLIIFFFASILVIIGTYLLFITGSITLIKCLKKNKRFYYQPRNFISLSNMIFRMKKNGAGLASICILSTMILIILSTTVCLNVGKEESINSEFVGDITVSCNEGYNSISKQQLFQQIKQSVWEVGEKLGVDITLYKDVDKNTLYFYMKDDTVISFEEYEGESNIDKEYTRKPINVITLDEYNRLENKNEVLQKDEVLLYCYTEKYNSDVITIANKTLKVKNQLNSTTFTTKRSNKTMGSILWLIVDSEETKKEIINYYNLVNEKAYNSGKIEYLTSYLESYFFYIKIDGNEDDIQEYTTLLDAAIKGQGISAIISDRTQTKEQWSIAYGGLLFLGVFLGILFTMAMVLIIYFKQMSESYEDMKQFEILKKVGMDKREIKGTIYKQIHMVFFLPIIVSIIHVVVAFPLMQRLLIMFGLLNTELFILCITIVVIIFTTFYSIVYFMTGKISHFDKIVSE